VVLDTNVLLDLWLFDDPTVRVLRSAIESRRIIALRSPVCDHELADVLARRDFGLDEASRAALLQRWLACSEPIVTLRAAPLACADADDQKFLDAAFSAGADALLTRDNALLCLASGAARAGLRILRPADLAALDASGRTP
jgi:putative PIN family toxin of toxin-antitoxin system